MEGGSRKKTSTQKKPKNKHRESRRGGQGGETGRGGPPRAENPKISVPLAPQHGVSPRSSGGSDGSLRKHWDFVLAISPGDRVHDSLQRTAKDHTWFLTDLT